MDVFKTQILRRNFSDFDELTDAAQGWNLELCKLDTTPFLGETFQLITPDFILSRGRFNCRLRQGGEPPPGFRTFAVSAVASHNMLWRSQSVTGNDLLIFPTGGELHAFSEPGFDVFTLSIAESTLEKFIWMDGFKGSEVHHCTSGSIERLRRLLHQTVQSLENAEIAKNAILHQLAQLMEETHPGPSPRTPHSRRIQSILQAERFIMANPTEPATVRTLCEATGVSKRTLEYAFNNHLGISPKNYINAMRLNGVHKQLRAGQAGQIRVVDAANAWGYWHMGQFAADYRKLFGEKPSATLGCDAQPCKSTCPYRSQCLICRGA